MLNVYGLLVSYRKRCNFVAGFKIQIMNRTLCYLIGSFCGLLSASSTQAQTFPQDSLLTDSVFETRMTASSADRFHANHLIIPGTLIAVGAWGLADGWWKDQSRHITGDVNRWSGGRTNKVDGYLRFLPAMAYLGLGYLGVDARHSLGERVVTGLVATVATEAMVGGLKKVVKETRPDASDRHSFPSGHTAIAFMGAELVRSEYGWGYGIGAYAVAFGVGTLRMYNNKHWAHDVLAGAGIGILGARIGWWTQPITKKLFRKNKETAIAMCPFYSSIDRGVGGTVAIVF